VQTQYCPIGTAECARLQVMERNLLDCERQMKESEFCAVWRYDIGGA
jgi:hypothetical protein